jgi:hypothetical protein
MIKNLLGGLAVAIMASSGAQAATVNRSADAIPAAKYVNASAAKVTPSACNQPVVTLKGMKKTRTGTWVSACANPQFMQAGGAAAGGSGVAPATASTLLLASGAVAAGASVASLVIVADRSR